MSTATAKVTVTLEITGLGCWEEDCPLSQIKEQATEGAIGKLSKLVQAYRDDFKIIGVPKCQAVLVD